MKNILLSAVTLALLGVHTNGIKLNRSAKDLPNGAEMKKIITDVDA